jgi:hypothetical protein
MAEQRGEMHEHNIEVVKLNFPPGSELRSTNAAVFRKALLALPVETQSKIFGDGKCAMRGCPRLNRALVRIDSTTDGTMFIVRACEQHYETIVQHLAGGGLPLDYFTETRTGDKHEH